jgi:hypothetical protein
VPELKAAMSRVNGVMSSAWQRERISDMLRLSDVVQADQKFKRMSDYLVDYYDDPNRSLAPLFDIIELAARIFGHKHKAANALNIGVQKMKEANDIINDSSIRSGRHRGKELGPQRDPTAAEIRKCEEVAEEIITHYAELVRGRKPTNSSN